MIYKRYANPMQFIDNLIENKCFYEGIKTLIYETNKQMQWELYCHSINSRFIMGDDSSFDDWLQGSKKGSEEKYLSNDEIIKAKNKSNEVLKSISPKKKGGKG